MVDCIGSGTDITDEDALVSCVASKSKGTAEERSVLFLLEQLDAQIQDT